MTVRNSSKIAQCDVFFSHEVTGDRLDQMEIYN